jgi:hypothetical protein
MHDDAYPLLAAAPFVSLVADAERVQSVLGPLESLRFFSIRPQRTYINLNRIERLDLSGAIAPQRCRQHPAGAG